MVRLSTPEFIIKILRSLKGNGPKAPSKEQREKEKVHGGHVCKQSKGFS